MSLLCSHELKVLFCYSLLRCFSFWLFVYCCHCSAVLDALRTFLFHLKVYECANMRSDLLSSVSAKDLVFSLLWNVDIHTTHIYP